MTSLAFAGALFLVGTAVLDDINYLKRVMKASRPNQKDNPVVNGYWAKV